MNAGLPAPKPRLGSIVDCAAAAARSAEGVTFVGMGEQESRLGWDELCHRGRCFAGGLLERGVERGERVALSLSLGPEALAAFLGIRMAAAVPVFLTPPGRLGPNEEHQAATRRKLQIAACRLIVADARSGRSLVTSGQLLSGLSCIGPEALLSSPPADPREASPEDLALVQFSSGSTGEPRGVALTEANLMAQCEVLSALVSTPADEREVVVSWLPLYHDMGLIGGLLYPLFRQRPLVLLSTEAFMARPGLWLRAISRHRGTVSPAPNFAYVLCLKRVPDSSLEGVRLDCWRDALNGAEPVSEQICAEFTRRFAPYGFRPEAVRPVYGLAEASLAVTAVPPRPELRVSRLNAGALAAWGTVEEGTHAIVSVGKPLPGIQVEVRSEAGEPLPEGRLGRIFVQGPSVMRGYLGDPEATASVLRDGWLDTGDLGFVRDGELHVCGRAKDVVIIRGANHAPQEFEGPALQVPGVRMGAAVAVGYRGPDAEGEELLVLVERARAAPADLEAQVTAAVLAKTGVRPARVVVLPRGALPRTSSGKLRRRETIRRYIAGLLQASSTGSPDEHPSGPDTGAAARSST